MNKKLKLILWILAAIIVMSAAYTVYLKAKPVDDTASKTAQGSESVMAPDFKLRNLKGDEVSLSDYKGKFVFINFWAVWCKYCKIEMPELQEFNDEIAKAGDAVLLTVDVQEDIDTVVDYMEKNDLNLQVLMDTEGAVAQSYGVSGYPTTFVVNKDGSAYTYISGATDKKTLNKILSDLRNGK